MYVLPLCCTHIPHITHHTHHTQTNISPIITHTPHHHSHTNHTHIDTHTNHTHIATHTHCHTHTNHTHIATHTHTHTTHHTHAHHTHTHHTHNTSGYSGSSIPTIVINCSDDLLTLVTLTHIQEQSYGVVVMVPNGTVLLNTTAQDLQSPISMKGCALCTPCTMCRLCVMEVQVPPHTSTTQVGGSNWENCGVLSVAMDTFIPLN